AIGGDGAGVIAGGREGPNTAEHVRRRRRQPTLHEAVAELAGFVVAPATDAAGYGEGTRVIFAGADGRNIGQDVHCPGCEPWTGTHTVTELAESIRAPAANATVGEERAGMRRPHRDGLGGAA